MEEWPEVSRLLKIHKGREQFWVIVLMSQKHMTIHLTHKKRKFCLVVIADMDKLVTGQGKTRQYSREPTWMIRETFPDVSPCLTTTTSAKCSPYGEAGVDIARSVMVAERGIRMYISGVLYRWRVAASRKAQDAASRKPLLCCFLMPPAVWPHVCLCWRFVYVGAK